MNVSLSGQTKAGFDSRCPLSPPSLPHERNECGKGVLAVPNGPTAVLNRPLSERERDLLLRWCGHDNDPIILEAIKLFNARG
jgi:hypothetical protein